MALSADVRSKDTDYGSGTAVIKQFRSYDDIYFLDLQNQSVSPSDFTALRKKYSSSGSDSGDSSKYIFYDDTDVDRLIPKFRGFFTSDDFSKKDGNNNKEYDYYADEDTYYDRSYGNHTREEIDEINRKIDLWEASKRDEDRFTEFDTTEAFLLELDGHKLEEISELHYHCLFVLSTECRYKIALYNFTDPGEPLVDGGSLCYEGSRVRESEMDFPRLSRLAVQRYNKFINTIKLEFLSVFKAVTRAMPLEDMFLSFTAIDLETNLVGTYQAAVSFDFAEQVYLVFLRHVEADKVLFLMKVTEIEEMEDSEESEE